MEHLRKPDPSLAEQILLFPAEAGSSNRDHVTSSHKEQCHLYQDRKCFNFMWSTHMFSTSRVLPSVQGTPAETVPGSFGSWFSGLTVL